MKRLTSPVQDGGLPYLNSDFNDILQREHIKAYAGHLDAINDRPLGSVDRHRGIVLKGCTVVSGDANTTVFNFINSLVYLPGLNAPGDFYEPSPSITNANYTVSSTGGTVYIVPAPDVNESRIFRDGITKVAVTTKYFTVQTATPASDVTYIQFVYTPSLNRVVTQRNYKRLLKYFTANNQDIFMTGNLSDFDTASGMGYGDMWGFALCDGQNNRYNLRGRFVMGFDSTAPATPADATTIWDTATSTQTYNGTDVINYGAINNIGGGRKLSATSTVYYPSKVLTIPEMPVHNHTGTSGLNSIDLDHYHAIGDFGDSAGGNFNSDIYGRGNITRKTRITGSPNKSLDHTHSIPSQGGFNGHEIRSPYLVAAYYQKIIV
jgi:hypothetical protein